MDGRLAAGQHQDVDPAALALDRRVERAEDVRQPGEPADPGCRGGEARRALEVAVLGDVEEQHARVLGLEVAEAVEVAHRDRRALPGVSGMISRVGVRHCWRYSQSRVVLLVQAHDLAVAAPADPPEVDGPVHRHEVALEDVGLVVDLAVGVLGEAAAAHGQDHAQRREGAEGEHRASPASR